MNSDSLSQLSSLYSDDFYRAQIEGSYKSAKYYVQQIRNFIKPRSVVDVGCGRGTWLKAFGESGSEILIGLDGGWNSQDQMIDKSVIFRSVDLNNLMDENIDGPYDLAISLEVAEHLESSAAAGFIKAICLLSDVVIFGAAYSNQGGTNHINEQPHTYWAKLFLEEGYSPYDLFRPKFWGEQDVEFWYQQNTFLYIRKESDIISRLDQVGIVPIENINFMNCVHPELYNSKLSRPTPTLESTFGDINFLTCQHQENFNELINFLISLHPHNFDRIMDLLIEKGLISPTTSIKIFKKYFLT